MLNTAAKFCQKVAQNLWKIETRWVLRQALKSGVKKDSGQVLNKFIPIMIKKIFFITLLISNGSLAAGYSTGIYSTSGLGNSYAGSVTGIHDASDVFFNPAISANLANSELIVSETYLKINSKPEHVSSNKSGINENNAGVDSQIPELFFAMPINKKMAFALAITSPFGLATKYDQNWVGRYHAVESSIATVNFNPSLSYKFFDDLSVGVGLVAQYYKTTLTKMVNIGYDAIGKAHGSDLGYGYNLGASYRFDEYLKFGVGYRSKIDHTLIGTSQIINFAYSDIQAKTTTPESLVAGIAFKADKNLELAYDANWTRWSRLKKLSIHAYQNSILSETATFNWHDSFLHSIGANFTLNDQWLIRSGLAYEKDATSDSARDPKIPTSDRVWISAGFNYKINKSWEIDVAYVHQFFKTAKVDLINASAGNLNAHYKTRVDVFSIAAKQMF